MKVSILTFIALYCIGTSAAFADGSRATSNKQQTRAGRHRGR
ncbi:hypothetical protein [Pseudomonas fluorescens]